MRFYESIFIARPDLLPPQVEALAQDYANIIKEDGGEVIKTEFCGLRNLAYRLKKHRRAHYVLMNLKATAAGLTEMERRLKLNEDVLRYLSVRVEKLDPNPSALIQQKNYRDRYGTHDDFMEERTDLEETALHSEEHST